MAAGSAPALKDLMKIMDVVYGDCEWDKRKALSNKKDHGVSFENAARIFEGMVITRKDSRKSYGEERKISIGKAGDIIVLTVVHTERGDRTRIISARKASRKEREIYYAYVRKKAH